MTLRSMAGFLGSETFHHIYVFGRSPIKPQVAVARISKSKMW